MSFWSAVAERRGFFLISLGILIADQVTKVLAFRFLGEGRVVTLIPGFFRLDYSVNRGGLFGYFRDWSDPWRTLLLTLLPVVAIVLIAGFLAKTRVADRPTLFGLCLILGGAAGNLIDRILRGAVIDFLDAYIPPSAVADRLVGWFGTAHWPTFNVADSAIVVGACLLVLDIVRPRRESEQASDPASM